LIVHGRGRAGEMIDLVHFREERVNNVMAGEFEIRIPQKVTDIVFCPAEKIVQAENIISTLEQRIAEMTPNEPRSARHQHPLARIASHSNPQIDDPASKDEVTTPIFLKIMACQRQASSSFRFPLFGDRYSVRKSPKRHDPPRRRISPPDWEYKWE
jgi:hypothetical protein